MGCGDDDGSRERDAGPDASRYEALELRFQSEMSEKAVGGAAFAVVEGGAVTHAMGYGYKDPDATALVAPTTLFRIASVTKMMTAVALLQQVEDGAVALDDPVVDHIPGFVLSGDATTTADVTVAHLLTHATGMIDNLTHDATEAYEGPTALHDYTYEVYAAVGFFQSPPGRMYNYCNPGYALAGLIIEQSTGTLYGPYMRDHVFGPLGMNRTVFSPAEVLADGDYAVGEITKDGYVQQLGVHRAYPDTYDNPWGWPAGYAYSSVLDLGAFVGFMRAGDPTVLADALRVQQQSPQINTFDAADLIHYGYGILLQDGLFVGEDFYDLQVISHKGSLGGFSSELTYVPGCDLGFITLANTDGAYFDQSLEVALRTLCELPPASVAPNLDADPADHPDYVGTYHEPQYFGELVVTRDGTELRIEIPTLIQTTEYDPVLIPLRKDVYLLYAWGDHFDVTFIRDATGQAEYMRNRGFVGHRVSAGSPPPPPPRSLDPGRELARRRLHLRWLPSPLLVRRSRRQKLRRFLRSYR